MSTLSRGLIPRIESSLGATASWAYRHHRAVLAAALVATVVSIGLARTLRVDTDLTHLLPATFESVTSLKKLEERSYGVGYVSVVLRGSDAQARRKAADALAVELEALPTIQYVDFQKPTPFFVDRAFYFMDVADLETVRDRLEERHLWEVRSRSSMFDLELEPLGEAPSLAFDDLRAKYEPMLQRSGTKNQDESAYFEDDTSLVLLARPSRRSSDVGFNDTVVHDVTGVVSSFDTAPYAAGGSALDLTLSGRYVKKAQQKAQIESDLGLASLLAVGLVLAYLAFHFRRASSMALVMVPLVLGLSWTFAAAALLFGSLNLLTGFIGALLLGVGIDHGIHLLSRIEHEGAGDDPATAVQKAFGTTGRAVVAAALTTMVAFFGVAASEFRAFREFGIIAGVGLILIVIAYTTVLPALVAVLPRAARREHETSSTFARALPRWAPVTGWIGLLAAIAAMSFAKDVRFDYDFASLESANLPAFRLDKEVNRILGRSQTPLVVLADDAAHERVISQALREHQKENPSSGIQLVMSLDDLVPQGVADKQPVIREIGATLKNAKASWFDSDQNAKRKRLIAMTEHKPFARADLPVEVRRQFLGRDGNTSFVLVYPSVSLSDGQAVRALAEELRAVRLPDGQKLVIAGEAMVLADVLNMVISETPVVIGITLGLVVLVLLVLLGTSLVWPCAAAAFTTIFVTAGLMPLVGLQLNYLNIVVVPVLFGMAVDGAVHVMVRYRSEGDVVATTNETGRAVAGAILTTALGFGAFALAHHPGLQSLAHIAVLGLAVNLLVCLVLVPSGIALVERFRASRAEGGHWTRLAVTTGLAGDSPVAPGTLGALVAVPFALLGQRLSMPWRAGVLAAATAGSVFVVARYLRRTKREDPSEVVIDELVGCLIAMLLVPEGVVWAASAFVLFRLLDIVKPWPIGYIDRRVHGAWGVMGDDVVAGVVAGVGLYMLHHFGVSTGWWS